MTCSAVFHGNVLLVLIQYRPFPVFIASVNIARAFAGVDEFSSISHSTLPVHSHTQREREGERERERERERDWNRERDWDTERERDWDTERESYLVL